MHDLLAESRFVIDAVPAGIWWFAAPTAGDGIDYCTAFTSSTPEGAAKYRWSSWRRRFTVGVMPTSPLPPEVGRQRYDRRHLWDRDH
ncbi:hypothetical protein I553_1741 [Mycobacterium xenopi 4042]|uniref:Uncharacterized protein n=1 Tax=Mycobacterium xenopi 4042 TaxID=1299334 RepID=X8DLF3_MYCXE|nr:hypothetical protein I553_1741 [Mycobacterium xenopi 4042]